MKELVEFMKTIGITPKEIHDSKSRTRIQLIAKKYGVGPCPMLNKIQSNDFLKKFLSLEEKTPESFIQLFTETMRSKLTSRGPSYEKLDEHLSVITNLPGKKFYQTPEWRDLRYRVLKSYGNKCAACGRSPRDGVIIHVDHILPRSIYPEHALTFNNMQVLCEDCNLGKSNKHEDNWITRK